MTVVGKRTKEGVESEGQNGKSQLLLVIASESLGDLSWKSDSNILETSEISVRKSELLGTLTVIIILGTAKMVNGTSLSP